MTNEPAKGAAAGTINIRATTKPARATSRTPSAAAATSRQGRKPAS